MGRNMLSGNPAATTRTSRYVRAAAELADDQVAMQRTIQENAPDYGELSEKMAEQKRLNAEAAIKAQQNIRVQKMQGEYDLDELKGDIKLTESLRKKNIQTRMAGKVAAAGVLYAEAKTRRDPDAPLGYDFSKQEADLRKRQEELKAEGAKINADEKAELDEILGRGSPQVDPTSQTSGTLPLGSGKFEGGTLDPQTTQAIKATADRLGVDVYSLGGLFELESTHRPNVWGGAGGNYRGLIQFGPGARSEVGLPDRDMTITEQLPYVERYFQQRGFKPGQHGVTELYRTVLVGNPGQSGTDSWGTNSDSAARRMMPGGDLYQAAQRRYGSFTPTEPSK